MPQLVNYPINYKRAKQWADSQCDNESKDFAEKIIEYTEYVSFGDFMGRLKLICESYLDGAAKWARNNAGETEYVLILPFPINKSNTWVSLLAFEWISSVITHVYSDITSVFNDSRRQGSPLYGKVIRCVICDDCVYTASQLVGAISTFDFDRVMFKSKKEPPDVHSPLWLKWHKETRVEIEDLVEKIDINKFSVDVIVPYISTLAEARLHKIHYVRVPRHARVFPIFSQKVNMDRMPIQIQKEFKRTFQYHKEISAIYFDHKVADAVSTFNKIYLLAPLFNCVAANKTVCFIDGCDAAELPEGVRANEYYPDIEKKVRACPPTFYKGIAYTFDGVVVDAEKTLLGATPLEQPVALPHQEIAAPRD